MILHIDMDAFFASIEQAVNPRLKGKPLIVGSRGNKMHTVVCAASYEAKACGIHSGMPSAEAFKICPGLEFVVAEQGKYIWTSGEIFKMLKEYDFEVEYASIDEFRMDIGEAGEPVSLAEGIRRQINERFNITASVGIADNSILAKLASKLNKPNGVMFLTRQNSSEILAKTPVSKICGIGKKTNESMLALNIKSCLDLYLKPVDFLEGHFGKNGLGLYASLHAQESFSPEFIESKPKSIGHSYTLSRVSQNPGVISAWIRLLSDMVADRLRHKNLASKTLHLWLNGPEIGGFSRQKTFPEAIYDGYEISLRCLKIMAEMGCVAPKIRALGVTCSNLSPLESGSLLYQEIRREDLLRAMDQINDRHGKGSIYPAKIALIK